MKHFIIIWIVTLVGFVSIASASTEVSKLKKDIGELHVQIVTTEENIEKAKDELKSMERSLDKPIQAQIDIRRLRITVQTIDNLLSIPASIPQTESAANTMKSSLINVDKILSTAQRPLDSIANTAKSMQDKVTKAKSKITHLHDKLSTFKTALNRYNVEINDSQECLHQYKKNKHKTCKVQKDLNNHAEKMDSNIRSMKDTLHSINSKMKKIEDLKRLVDRKLKHYKDIEHQLDGTITHLSSTMTFLNKLKAKLDSKVCFSFPIPDPTSSNPFQIKQHKIEMSVKIALEGVTAIEKKVKDMLSKYLYAILDELHVGNIFRSLEDRAKKLISDVTGKLKHELLSSIHLDKLTHLPSIHIGDFAKDLDFSTHITEPNLHLGISCRKDCH